MKILCIVEVVELHEDKVGSFTIIFKIVREMKSSCKNGSLPEKSGELACLHDLEPRFRVNAYFHIY